MSEFKRRNRQDWVKAVEGIFPSGVPETARWTSPRDMIQVISGVARRKLNHTLFPSGGGLDLTGIKESAESGCVELAVGTVAYILRPACLTFHSFAADPSEAYFRLEAQSLAPSGVYPGLTVGHEELVELTPTHYHHRSAWDEQNLGEDENGMSIPLPRGSRLAIRYFQGVFLIVAKGSLYNSFPATYDGRHNTMSDSQFRGYMEQLINQNKEWIDQIDRSEAA